MLLVKIDWINQSSLPRATENFSTTLCRHAYTLFGSNISYSTVRGRLLLISIERTTAMTMTMPDATTTTVSVRQLVERDVSECKSCLLSLVPQAGLYSSRVDANVVLAMVNGSQVRTLGKTSYSWKSIWGYWEISQWQWEASSSFSSFSCDSWSLEMADSGQWCRRCYP